MLKINLNDEKQGIEIMFTEKPDAQTINKLKEQGFRWSPKGKFWYAKQSPERLSFAESLNSGKAITETEPKQTLDIFSLVNEFTEGTTDPDDYRYRFVGSNYDPKLTNKQISSIIKKHLSSRFPFVKWSASSKGYNSINLSIKESPFPKHSEILEAIIKYAEKLLNSYNFNDSDMMTDYFHVNFYDRVSIEWDYTQTELSPEMSEAIEIYNQKVAAEEEAEETRREIEYQKRQVENLKYEEQRKIRELEEQKELALINESAAIKELSEPSQYMIINVKMAHLNKNQTIAQYYDECSRVNGYYYNDIKIHRELHFDNPEVYNLFTNNLLTDFDFLANSGGSWSNDINSMTDYYNMTEAERAEVIFRLTGIAVYLNSELKFVIDTQGYNYARYVGLVEEAERDEIPKPKEPKENPDAETLLDYSAEVITAENLQETWKTEVKEQYITALKRKLSNNKFKLTKEIIQDLPRDYEELKAVLYEILTVCDSLQSQFAEANFQQGES